MNKPSLVLQQRLQTNLTPELRQAIRLMQLSAQQLQQEIQTECAVNPFLELDEDVDPDESDLDLPPEVDDADHDYESDLYEDVQPQATAKDLEDVSAALENDVGVDASLELSVETEWSDLYLADGSDSSATQEVFAVYTDTLQEHLRAQLRPLELSTTRAQIIDFLIESINDDGYLFDWEDLRADARRSLKVTNNQIETGLATIHSLSPSGVGARSVQECLFLQLNALPESKENRELALKIVRDYFDQLTNQDHYALATALNAEELKLESAIELIQSLHPRPGAAFVNVDPLYVVPDVLVSKQDGEWTVSLNDRVTPTVRVNPMYKSMDRKALSEKDQNYFKEYLHRAQALIYGVKRRKETLLKVALAIVEEQKEFFERGTLFMRPMAQSDLASMVGVHTSTVSRITTEKYLLCARGTFELKYFFSSGLRAHRGDDVSSTTIRAMIQRWTEKEDPNQPLTDTAIAAKLKERQISIARRTVTKYREALHIPPVQQRRAGA